MDCSPPASFLHRVFPLRIVEWVAISSSRDQELGTPETRNPSTLTLVMTWQEWNRLCPRRMTIQVLVADFMPSVSDGQTIISVPINLGGGVFVGPVLP